LAISLSVSASSAESNSSNPLAHGDS
jgi:hypothetical protein